MIHCHHQVFFIILWLRTLLTTKGVFCLCFFVNASTSISITYSLDVHKAWYMVTLFPQMPISFPGSLSSSCILPFYGFFLPIGFELEVAHPQFCGPSGSFGSPNCSVLTQYKHWLPLFPVWISLLALRYGDVAILCNQQSMKLNSCGYCEAQFISQSCSLDSFSGKEREKQRMLRWDSLSCHGKPCIALVWGRLTLFFSFYHWKKGIEKQRTMRWDSLSSHGLPHIPLVWGQRLTHCFSLFCWKREKSTTRWEEHLIPQLTQEDPNNFNMGGETHPSPHGAPLAKEEKSSAWSEGIFHPIHSPLKGPPIPSVQWLQLTQLRFLFLCKKERRSTSRGGGTACHPMGNPYSFGPGKKTHLIL